MSRTSRRPLVYLLLSAFSGSCLVLIINWRGGPPETTRRLSRRWIAGYGAVCAAIVLLFVLGEAPVERLRDFDTYYANTPYIREMIVLYLTGVHRRGRRDERHVLALVAPGARLAAAPGC